MMRAFVSAMLAVGIAACSTQRTFDGAGPTSEASTMVAAPSSEKPFPEVTGTVTYRERIALQTSAVVMVRLVDASRQDVPAVLIGEQLIPTQGRQVPFRFAIPYDPEAIDERGRYLLQARIEERGRLLFVTDRAYPVITNQGVTHADLLLKAVN